MVVSTCNHSYLGGWGRRIAWAREFKMSLGNIAKPCLYKKYKQITWAWRCAPLVPTTWEVEMGGSPEPGRLRLQWAMIILHQAWETEQGPVMWKILSHYFNYHLFGWAQWPIPVILALWEAKAGGLPELRSSRPAWAHGETPSLLKIQKIHWAWWCIPVIPATWESWESLEPRRWRLQWAKIVSLHSSLGSRVSETPSQK